MAREPELPEPGSAAPASTYLVFGLGPTDYAVDVARVREIVGLLPITRVPQLPAAVRGLINLRGRVIPVLDLRTHFGLDAADHDRRTCIIVFEHAGSELGAIVDHVAEVARIPASSIEEPPQFGAAVDAGHLLGVARCGERVRLLLDLDRAVSRAELAVAQPAT